MINATGRLHNLDYLRGLAAFGIMIYHYLSWTYGHYLSDSFLGRVGVYGVSVFYILSGLTLFYVYRSKLEPFVAGSIDFIVKRIFRIFPLLWLVVFATLAIRKTFPGIAALFLNLTGLFGFVSWDESIAAGSWSIGNELVFYALFLPYMFLLGKNRLVFIAAVLAAFAIYLYFAFVVMDPSGTLTTQWRDYVNPLNQFFLFLGGIIIGYTLKDVDVSKAVAVFILAAGLALFIFYPVEGNTIRLVSGVNRLVFTLSCLMICTGFYKMKVELPAVLLKPFTLLGEGSYSVYLIHPLVFLLTKWGINFFFRKLHFGTVPPVLTISAAVCITLVVSYFVYEYYEKYFMRLGRQTRSLGKSTQTA